MAVFNEQVRLLYVSLTRASSRLYLYFRAEEDSFPYSSISAVIDPNSPTEALRKWAGANTQWAHLQAIDPTKPTGSHTPLRAKFDLSAATFDGEIPFGYLANSFSGLMKRKDLAEKDRDSETPHTKTRPEKDRRGAFGFPSGPKAGDFFHVLLENIDFRETDHSEMITQELYRHGLPDADPQLAAQIIQATLEAELIDDRGKAFQLCELPPNDRLNELGFHFTVGKLCFKELGENLLAEGIGGPFAEYLSRMPKETAVIGEEFLKGFIDLTFRRDGQYFILDWKSNLLGGKQADFHQDILVQPMTSSDYMMQYHLYVVALHRFLGQRLREYDYDQHFGGVYYLFMRGMLDPKQPGDGIYFDKPERHLVERLDQALSSNMASSS